MSCTRKLENAHKKIKAKDTVLVCAFILFLIGHYSENSIYFYVAGGVSFLGMLTSAPFEPVSKVWFGLSEVLGDKVSLLALGLVYFLILTPIAMLYRLVNKNPLLLKNNVDSTLADVETKYLPAHLESPF